MPSLSESEQPTTGAQWALLGAVTYAALQGGIGSGEGSAPSLPDPNLERLWRSLLVEFNALHLDRVRARLGEQLPDELFELHWGRESSWHAEFMARSYERLRQDLDTPVTPQRLEQIVARERYWGGLHFLAAARRARAITAHYQLRITDPRSDVEGGAIWRISPLKRTHTADCLAANGRAFTWRILRFYNPANRHPECGCTLHGTLGVRVRLEDRPPEGMAPGFDIGEITPPTLFHFTDVPSASELLAGMR